MYTVGEMARIVGVAPSTLRYYDQEGLLPFVERSKGGIRMFTDADYGSLMVIDCLKKSGLSIKEIKDFFALAAQGDASIGQRLALFEKRREAVKKQIQELEDTLSLLNFKCWYYETAQAAGTEAAVRDLPLDQVPPEHRAAKASLDIENSRGKMPSVS